jgi:hypothetical protein
LHVKGDEKDHVTLSVPMLLPYQACSESQQLQDPGALPQAIQRVPTAEL